MEPPRSGPFLIIGGTGVFGSRLAAGLVRDGVAHVVIAGRSEDKLRRVAEDLACGWRVLDRGSADLEAVIASLAPFAVVDASGPFQAYGGSDPYRVARAAIAAEAHYFDLSDDAAFTQGITALKAEARAAGVSVLSGVSSVPALSAAAVHALSERIARIDLIDSMILPGNRAPRGRSVMAAILEQVGRPLPGSQERAWIGSERIGINPPAGPALSRLASPISAPDPSLTPGHFGAADVRFRAGLELGIMHRGLEMIAHAVRLGLLPRARLLLRPAHFGARLLEPFGTDVGAMRVLVRGQTAGGRALERTWTLVARSGDGPHVPAIPGRALATKLIRGEIRPGARACLHDLTLSECETAAPERALSFHKTERDFVPLFQNVLGDAWGGLPEEIRRLHRCFGVTRWRGEAEVTRGRNAAARTIAALFRFPPEARRTPVSVQLRREDLREVWIRDFGAHRFRSRLKADGNCKGRLWERFGPFSFAIQLDAGPGALRYPVVAGRFLGIPLPGAILPRSDTSETVDAEGRVTFDVALSLPLVGRIVRYRGWLIADQPMRGDQEPPSS